MRSSPDTVETSDGRGSGARKPTRVPGFALIFAGGRAAALPIPLVDGVLELGRDHPALAPFSDSRISRHHARVCLQGGGFVVTDLDSRNGTSVDGTRLASGATQTVSQVLRVGGSLLLPLADIGPFQRLGVRVASGRIEGPALQQVLKTVANAGVRGSSLHITGESGAGKEGLARAFHAAGPSPTGPFTAVNCATIPEGVAERLLFGARRGAFSGADADADGYVQAAAGGTLFLDEIAELSLAVQAKLLRVLETGEVLALGAARPRKVELRLCTATHRDLRAQVAAGALREDLYFRIATPQVVAPPLRARPEEIAWLLEAAIDPAAPGGPSLHVSLVEACILRPWPGNVRELLAEARSAAQRAALAGDERVDAQHLGETAGSLFAGAIAPSLSRVPEERPPHVDAARSAQETPPPTRAKLVGLLTRHQGNVSAVARELGVQRTQLRRWLERHGIEIGRGRPGSRGDPPDDAG